ncbi:PREDICTED: uncharacterized protein LOC105969681 [Erythranthe guttata]|uniref:uncharacterized protein LOC105969681 n=1 Tax=Erythranthe guttata TaxID=4155 RepID=UPI00064DCC82|nr:PREDICTED: uncharacterized protein LOC105969681 [Erythranthe guttata]|eukprot:XP_012849908.1 PREDICTED: uncharacterized protein LOC105969681 [Erythranthe guttata]
MTQFRPISLSNVVYKIASKAIVNRLKPHMNFIISDSESAFVPSRLISHNILIAYEVVHYMKRSTAEHMAIKLDMSKAYDRIEWSFLRGVMSRLGSMQGSSDDITFAFCRRHDNFCNSNIYSAAWVKKILRVYEEASGQMVNYQKSSIVFSKTTTEENINLICSELPMEVVDNHDRYLGLSSTLGKSKREAFANLRDKVCRRLRGWTEKWFSRGGKEILIKAVIQAIPTYAMSCFRLPRYFIEEMEKHMAKFWWVNTKGKGIHWAKWQDMCSSKDFGGLGFRDLNVFNTALLVKQVWRLMVSPHRLLGRIYKARYYPLSNILDSSLGSNPSYTWRSICGAIDLLKKGTRWRIGNGENVQIWGDRWLPRGSTFKPFTPRGQWPRDMMMEKEKDGSNLASSSSSNLSGDEDVLHCLALCTFARQVWALSGVPYLIHWPKDKSVIEWVLWMKQHQDSAQFEDFDGRCVGWYSISCKQYFDSVTAEAMAALKALEFARDHDFRRVALEGDSSIIVAAIRGEDDSYTSYGNLINDIKQLATTFEEFLHIYHILREGNSAAHEIAKLSILYPLNFQVK